MGLHDREYYREPNDQMTFSVGGQSATMTLIVINAGVFLVDWLLELNLINWLGVRDSTLFNPLLWFQYLTYGFLHSTDTIWHILGNMFMLWMFGRMVEQHYGKKEFLCVYLTSVVLCGLLWNLSIIGAMTTEFAGGPGHLMVGASGAVSAIFTLFVCNFPNVTVYLWFLIPVPAWVIGVFVLISNLIGTDTQVAYSAHLAGIAFALAYFFGGLNLSQLLPGKVKMPSWSLRSRPRLRVHSPSEEEEFDPYSASDEEAEMLLDKVRKNGMSSLSETERRKLEDYSRRMRQKLS